MKFGLAFWLLGAAAWVAPPQALEASGRMHRHDESPDAWESRPKQGRWPLSQALQQRGVTRVPHRFSKAGQILQAEDVRLMPAYPQRGLGNKALTQRPISPRKLSDAAVRRHMGFLCADASGFTGARLRLQLAGEGARGQYYWHRGPGFDYVHVNDTGGNPWYGWYFGDRFFWTRYHDGHWWAFDDHLGRWSYWSGDAWYWQDPGNLSELYTYSDGIYVSVR